MSTPTCVKNRCNWCGDDPLYQQYHDHEWGVPLYDERGLFEFLILEGMQAGLSWYTVLQKREDLRTAFANFEVKKLINYTDKQLDSCLLNPKLIRNKRKIYSVRDNARAWLEIKNQTGQNPVDFLWHYTNHQPILNHWQSESEIPASTDLSKQMAKELKKLGFKFVGETICYAFMQATGMVNDHVSHCFRYHNNTEAK